MRENAFYVFHIVTREKMKIGQIINFDKDQRNTLYNFFFEREFQNTNGEDFFFRF